MSLDIREGIFVLDGRDIPFRLERRKGRRRVSIFVEPRQGLILRTPPRFPLRDVEETLREEEDWIRDKLLWRENWLAEHPERRFVTGETLLLLGEEWTLDIHRDPLRKRAQIQASDGIIRVDLSRSADARSVLEAWMRRLARRIVLARVDHWSARVGKRARRVTLRDTRSRWGSCSSTGNLSFSWKLIMAPPEVLDYVVVHELCHFVHLDHSPAYWALVERYLPDYASLRRWLSDEGARLYF